MVGRYQVFFSQQHTGTYETVLPIIIIIDELDVMIGFWYLEHYLGCQGCIFFSAEQLHLKTMPRRNQPFFNLLIS